MWDDVRAQLADVLSSRLYPTLKEDPGYIVFLRRAGLAEILDKEEFKKARDAHWHSSTPMNSGLNLRSSTANLSHQRQLALKGAAQVEAAFIIESIVNGDCLREKGAKAVVLQGRRLLYRLWDSKQENETRHWWFTQNLLDCAKRESVRERKSTREWLRERLAISKNFGSCDSLSCMELGPSSALPAVEGWGLAMLKEMPSRSTEYSTGANRVTFTHNYSKYPDDLFQGEKTQYFLPYIPADRFRPIPFP